MSDKNAEECAACGVRRDKHNTTSPCPRYVEPVSFTPASRYGTPPGMTTNANKYWTQMSRSVGKTSLQQDMIDMYRNLAIGDLADTRLEPRSYTPQEIMDRCTRQMENLERDCRAAVESLHAHNKALTDRVTALEKQLAAAPSFNPRVERLLHDKIDYTKVFSDEEDGLEQDYRGWPVPKDKIIF